MRACRLPSQGYLKGNGLLHDQKSSSVPWCRAGPKILLLKYPQNEPISFLKSLVSFRQRLSSKKVPQLDSHELLLLMIEVDRHSLRRQSSSFPFQISFRHSRIKLPRQLCPIQCMAQYLEVFGHGRELLLLAQNVGVENRSAIKPKTGHVPIVRGGIHPRFARIKVQG
jgi:hypothetical protein